MLNMDRTQLLLSFDRPESLAEWFPTDDVVMGGVSSSRVTGSGAGTALFTGRVSLENNGGFAAVRRRSPVSDLRAFSGLILRVRGDGKRYGVNLKTTGYAQALLYQVDFDTESNSWQEIILPFRIFTPRSVGFPVRNAPPLDLGMIRSIGLMIADKQAGQFTLELAWIKVYHG
jgi:hypothetical protein